MIVPAEQVEIISLLGLTVDRKYRYHYGSSKIKILYHLYNFGKGNKEIFPECETIAKAVGLSAETVSRFVNSEEFKKFGFKIWRPFTSNLYKLHPWLIECFKSLEKLGFMKHFRADFEKWRRLWKYRMPKFIQNKLLNISTWAQVFEIQIRRTKLRTNYFDRCGIETPLRCGTTRSSSSYEGSLKKNPEFPSCVQNTLMAAQELKNRFQILDGDVNWLINSFGLNDIKGGLRIRETWEKQGIIPNSPIKVFMTAISEHRKNKNGRKLL